MFFLFFIVGLALVSMCVSIVQMDVEMRFMKAISVIDAYSRERQRRENGLIATGGPIRPIKSVPVLNPFAFVPTASVVTNDSLIKKVTTGSRNASCP